ncbi:MAG: adenosylhomocysteinase [Candidatus Gracilibacteria bacterium]
MTTPLTDKQLLDQGRKNLALAERNMGALMKIRADYAKRKPFRGLRIAMALHVTKETGMLVHTLRDGGAQVAITSCNPLSTQDDVVAALKNDGIEAYGYKGESKQDYYRFLKKVLAIRPHITVDDGCDLVTLLHSSEKAYLKDILGGCEETTTGVIRLRAMQKDGVLKYPIIAVNDNKTKHLMDNYYGTGQSTIDAIMRASNTLFAGKTVVVAGYGDCGKGVSLRAKGLGANVIITEINPFKALQAAMDGFRVMPMSRAAGEGDIFITVTGNCEVIRPEHVQRMRSGAILANSGHFDVEIDVPGLEKLAAKKRRIRPYFDEYTIEKGKTRKHVYLVGEGRLANLVAAEGHPSEVMSMSFCGQALAVEYLMKNKGKLQPGVYDLPESIDEKISALQLGTMNIAIDTLTPRQKKYLAGWQEGT